MQPIWGLDSANPALQMHTSTLRSTTLISTTQNQREKGQSGERKIHTPDMLWVMSGNRGSLRAWLGVRLGAKGVDGRYSELVVSMSCLDSLSNFVQRYGFSL